MAKVIKPFRDKNNKNKRYNVGEEFPEKDKKRLSFLVEQVFLASAEKETQKPEDPDDKNAEGQDETSVNSDADPES